MMLIRPASSGHTLFGAPAGDLEADYEKWQNQIA
jgi:hypothetical protein